MMNIKQKIREKWLVGIAIFALLVAILLISAYSELVTDAGYIAAAIIASMSVLTISRKLDPIGLLREAKRTDTVFAGLFTLLLTVMIGYSELFANGIFNSSKIVLTVFAYALILPIYLLSCFFLVLLLMQKALKSAGEEAMPSRKAVWICTGVIALASVLFFLACPSGLLFDDGTYIWEQAIYNDYSDWHPICFTLIVKLCSLIYPHPISFIVLQTVVWILTNHLVLRILNRHGGARACKIYLVLSFTLGIIAYKYLTYFYKDPIFNMAILAFSACLFDYVKGHKGVCNFILLLVYGLLASCTRHMMIVPVAMALVVVIVCEIIVNRKKLISFARCYIPLLLVLLIVLNNVTYDLAMEKTDAVENVEYVTYTIPIYMLGAYAASDYEIDPQTKEMMERVMPVEEWETGYLENVYLADTLTRAWGYIGLRINILDEEITGAELIAANFRMFTDHPIYYVKSLTKISSIMWSISRLDGYAEWFHPSFDNGITTASMRDVEGYELTSTGTANVLTPILAFASTTPVIYNITCRGGVALFSMLLMIYVLIRKGALKYLCVALPTLFIVALLFLSIPAPDPRYILGVIEVAGLMIAITLTTVPKTKNKDIDKID